jgi:hypothetical protein
VSVRGAEPADRVPVARRVAIVGTSGGPAASVSGVRPGIVRGEGVVAVESVRRSDRVVESVVVVSSVRRVASSGVSLGVVIGSCGRLRRSSGDRVRASGRCVSAYGYCHCDRRESKDGNKHNDL